MADEKLMDRARDELFSHINRCGVLQAEAEDQRTWMDETIEYIAERYPDLSDADLAGLHEMGIRFCQPAIKYGSDLSETVQLIRRSAPEAPIAESPEEETQEVGAA
jgi:hypothetical protein